MYTTEMGWKRNFCLFYLGDGKAWNWCAFLQASAASKRIRQWGGEDPANAKENDVEKWNDLQETMQGHRGLLVVRTRWTEIICMAIEDYLWQSNQ